MHPMKTYNFFSLWLQSFLLIKSLGKVGQYLIEGMHGFSISYNGDENRFMLGLLSTELKTFGALSKPRKEVEKFKLFCCLTQSSIIISIAICSDFDGDVSASNSPWITQYSPPFLIHCCSDPRTLNKLMEIGDHFSFSAWIALALHSVLPAHWTQLKPTTNLHCWLSLMEVEALIKRGQFAN